MTQTVAQYILKSYSQLHDTCIKKIGKCPMPQLGDVDHIDVVTMIATYFSPRYDTEDYMPILMPYALMYGVTRQELETVYPNVKTFITDTIRILREKKF